MKVFCVYRVIGRDGRDVILSDTPESSRMHESIARQDAALLGSVNQCKYIVKEEQRV